MRFSLRWHRPGLKPPHSEPHADVWIDRPLGAAERAQIGLLARYWAPGHTLDAFLAGDYDFHQRHAEGIAETPLEVWDITADDGSPLFDLVLAAADCGWLFEAGTDTIVGVFRQWSFELFDGPPAMVRELEEGRLSADLSDKDLLLGLYAFVDEV